MCGISGFISTSPIQAERVVAMNASIAHRGPDDEGIVLFDQDCRPTHNFGWVVQNNAEPAIVQHFPDRYVADAEKVMASVALGHRRLSIVDLSALGHQPMASSDKRYWCVYNGEIYNHGALRAELQELGHQFISQCDTEILVAAYAEWGADCLQKLNGMWAFAIVDSETGTVFLARDRFGIKPLYYWVSPDGTFCFGSEIKQFVNFPGWSARLNKQRAFDFLAWGITDHSAETLFEGVMHLLPGHSLTVDAKAVRTEGFNNLKSFRWYDLNPAPYAGSFEEACNTFRHLLSESVELQLEADVCLGSCLSGGLDSSAIVCLIDSKFRSRGGKSDQKTFSAVSDIAEFDERQWIEKVIAGRPVDSRYVTPSVDELFDKLSLLAWHQDEPFATTSVFAQYKVMQLASDTGVKVMLDGQGADEQLCGYHGFLAPRFATLLRQGRLPSLYSEIVGARKRLGYSALKAVKYIGNSVLPEWLRQPLRAANGRTHRSPSWLSLEVLNGINGNQPVQHNAMRQMKTVRDMSISQITSLNLQMLLRWEDRNSMAHSIEARVPFLDHRLVEFAVSLPDEYKILKGMTKRVQRVGLDGILPTAIQNRFDKMGFLTPESIWITKTAPAAFRAMVEEAMQQSKGIIRDDFLDLVSQMQSGSLPFSGAPWRVISFGAWLKRFGVRV